MRRLFFLIVLCLPMMLGVDAAEVKRWGFTGDGVLDDNDINYMMTSPHPGNLPTDLQEIWVSPDAGGFLPIGTDLVCNGGTNAFQACTTGGDCGGGGTCDLANPYANRQLPLASISAARDMVNRNGIKWRVWFDSGDTFDGTALGSNGMSDIELQCASNEEVCVVAGPDPQDQMVTFDWYWPLTGGTNSGTSTSGSGTTLVDSGQSWTVDELIGAEVTVTSTAGSVAHGVSCAITDNDATSITVGTCETGSWADPTTDTDYIIVAPATSGTTGNHFSVNGGEADGLAIFYGMEVLNAWVQDAFACDSRNPTNLCDFWNVHVRQHHDGTTAAEQAFHGNEEQTGSSAYINVSASTTNGMGINTSGNSFIVGSTFQRTGDGGGNAVANVFGWKNLHIRNSYIERNTDTAANEIIFSSSGPSSSDEPAESCDNYFIGNRFVGNAGTSSSQFAYRFQATSAQDCSSALAWMRFNSMYNAGVCFAGSFTDADNIQKTLDWEDGLMDECQTTFLAFMSIGSNGNDIHYNIHDMAHDLTDGANPRAQLGGSGCNTLSACRQEICDTDLSGDPDGNTCEGQDNAGECDAEADCNFGFFGTSAGGDSPDFAGGQPAALGVAAVPTTDLVSYGFCHSDNSECWNNATGTKIQLGLPSVLCAKSYMLPDGDQACSIDIDAPPHKGAF